MKSLKNILAAGLLALFAIGVGAQQSTTLRVAVGGYTNLHVGPAEVNQFVLSTTTTNAPAYASFFDTPSQTLGGFALRYTNVAYIAITNYATNYISVWTNFFGRTNTITNLALVTLTNTVPATTNFYNNVLTLNASAGQSSTLTGVEYLFSKGVGVTNLGAAPFDITINYSSPPNQ